MYSIVFLSSHSFWCSYMRIPLASGSKRLYEVHYKSTFVQCHPWGEEIKELSLPISHLCHVTHNKQAKEIIMRGNFCFKTHQKPGKSYVGQQLGESYSCVLDSSLLHSVLEPDTPCYKPIYDSELMFPGFYSWWGLAIDTSISQSLPREKMPAFLPGYLQQPPTSMYGGNAFISMFSNLLKSYASSRGCSSTDIYMKIGGTLRYKHEIGYVVIVCTTNDLEELKDYAAITHAPSTIFNTNGAIDSHGRLVNMSTVPIFTTGHINAATSYETLNFAFYFREENFFVCSSDTINRCKIDHPFCIRTVPLITWYNAHEDKLSKKWICPDKITKTDMDTQANVMQYYQNICSQRGLVPHFCMQ